MYICLECGKIFNTPKKCIETHGLDTPPYETWHGCPYCEGNYTETYECDVCGQWITGEYVVLDDGTTACYNCYVIRDIADLT